MSIRNQMDKYKTPGIWITKDGTEFKIKDMTSAHIDNTIKHLRKLLDIVANSKPRRKRLS